VTAVTFWSLSPLYQSLGLVPPEHRFWSSNKIAQAKFRKSANTNNPEIIKSIDIQSSLGAAAAFTQFQARSRLRNM
jgi:hypothetical protein